MRVGLLYDLFEHYPWREGEPFDADAENEPEETIEALEEALQELGHDPVRIGPVRNLVALLTTVIGADGGSKPRIDIAINIAEGGRGRNREGEAPTLLEMLNIPYLGSDALTLSLSLDKVWTKNLAQVAGLLTPAHVLFPVSDPVENEPKGRSAQERTPNNSQGSSHQFDEPLGPISELPEYPLFVKPRYEGSAKGLTASSKVKTEEELLRQVDLVHKSYRQDALVESFVEGSEFTVAVVGHAPARTLPVLQRAVEAKTGIGLHVLDRKGMPKLDHAFLLPGDLNPDLELRLQQDAITIFNKLECRDFARIDFRVDLEGRAWFLEINPLPTFAPDGTFAIMAELMGESYAEFLSGVLSAAIKRVLS